MGSGSTYDALVIGAGPAGSAAAWTLARAGLRVALVEQQSFPRDKVCGDGLVADALGSLQAMGVRPAIEADAIMLRELRVYAPNGRAVSLAGDYWCVPRLHLDRVLVNAAVRAGAVLMEGMAAVAPRETADRVTGAAFRLGSAIVPIDAQVTLLATGANATALNAFGVPGSSKPNGVAGRAYFSVPPRLAEDFRHLCIVYDRSLCPGYGWIFPGPGRRFNMGVGYFSNHGETASLRHLWRRFLSAFEPARAIAAQSQPLTEFRGAPLRTGLGRFGRPGLLVIGEAAAMTYPATGEGIGKAMESGLLAGGLVADAIRSEAATARVHEAYESEFRARFAARYRAYRLAQKCTARPRLVDAMAWSANRRRFLHGELEALMAERGDPWRLFSTTGVLRSIFS